MLTRWNDFGWRDFDRTFANLDTLNREMTSLFDELGSTFGLGSARRPVAWPRIDLTDDGDALTLRAEVPGVNEKDLNLTLENNVLTLRGSRQDAAPEGYTVHRKERGAYSFARSFTLPAKVEGDKITATLRNGILELSLPKAAESRPKQITVSVN